MVYSDQIEDKIDQIIPELKKHYPELTNFRWYALKLLERDKEITEKYPVNLPRVIDRSYESDIINQKVYSAVKSMRYLQRSLAYDG